jgi:anti-sigma regulatory factor (Ser/Thr protein kinase)
VSGDEALVHQALLYADEDQFLSSAVPFLRDGLKDGGCVLAVVDDRNIEALRGTMGLSEGQVTFLPAQGFYRHPVRTIGAYSNIVHASLPRRVWALAEPVWQGWTPTQKAEWKRYESVVNAAFSTSGAQVICAYNTRTTSDDILESASLTHPILLEGQGPHHSLDYTGPDAFATDDDKRPLPTPPACPDVLALGEDLTSLRILRAFLTERLVQHGIESAKQTSTVLTAVTEVATNAINHGAPPMEVRIWAEDSALVCEVFDYGHWRPDALIGHLPREAGMGIGLWGVRLLADSVHVRAGWEGTTVRLTFPRTEPAQGAGLL